LVDADAWQFRGKNKLCYFIFFAPPCPKIASASLRGLIFVDEANKFSMFQKNGALPAT